MAVAGVVTQTSESWAQPIRQVLIYTGSSQSAVKAHN